ncbi:MFS general substrate transporter [Cubamyces menziesii]|nr:MFS general substrate transporter [Cubamyces menziesii]
MPHMTPPETVVPAALEPLEHREDSCKGSVIEDTEIVAVDSAIDNEPIVTRKELWSYYLYYNGDNGVGPLGYTVTLFQTLANNAGYDPAKGPGSSCSPSGQCVLPWAGGVKSVNSIVLIAQGVSFAIMTLLFTTVGSIADYGGFGRWVLLVFTVLCWATQFATISLTTPDRWRLGMALYMIGFITYGATLVFYAAIFPRLARNTAHARQLREKLRRGEISAEEYELEESMETNRISNISTAHSNIGYIVTLGLNLSILLPLASNPKVNNYTLLLTNGYWVLLGIWWFVFQQPRPGSPLPKGAHYATIGWKQIWVALQQYKQLPYTFMYLVGFFLLADGFNTTQNLVQICQNDRFQFSFLQNTYLGLAQAVTSTASTLGFWYIQRYWKISTKKMFAVTNVVTILLPLWGMVGLWSSKFGYRNVWEYWAYNVMTGLFQAPYYAFSQTMMAELTPPGYDNMFFGLFGLSNRASSLIGPNIVQAIIDKSGNNWEGFPFLFALCTCACLVIWFGVDVPKGRHDAAAWAEKRRSKNGEDKQPAEESEGGR